MHGTLIKVFVKKGDVVTKGMPLLILEAMKMQHEIRASIDGVVSTITSSVGTQVAADDLLIEIDAKTNDASGAANVN